MKHLFIVNPVAGGRDRTQEIIAKTAEIFVNGEDYEVYTTTAPGDATEKLRAEAQRADELRVYACGGDGTLNECVNGAGLRENVAVASFPGGTGNDFSRMFGAERERFFDLEQLVYGQVRKIDLIECCGRWGVNICSVGIDARIGTQVHKYSGLPLVGKSFGYVCSAAVNFFKGINQHLHIRFGTQVIDGSVAIVCACNGRYYGGGFNPVPQARPDDGVLDFIIIRGISRLNFLRLVSKYAKGRFREIPEKYLCYYRGSEVSIKSETPLCVNIDGEAIHSCEVNFRVVPGGINCVFPADLQFFECNSKQS